MSFINRNIVQNFDLKVYKDLHYVSSFTGKTSVLNEYVKCVTKVNNETAYVKYWILDESPLSIILGTEALKALRVTLSFSNATSDMIKGDLTRKQRSQLTNLIDSFRDVFSEHDYDIGNCSVLKHTIDVGDPRTFHSKQYPVPQAIKSDVKTKIDELLKHGIIRHSSSPWSNPIFFVRKKDGRLNLIVDFRKLNEITKTDCFPIPMVDEMFANLNGCKYFTSLDLTSGYYQVDLDEESKEKTAFVADNKLLEFNKLAFGLKNAPSLFQRIMQIVLVETGVLPYLDDVIIASRDFDKHLASIRNVLSRFRQFNLKAKPSKCNFVASELLYLGMLVSSEGIKPDPKKIESLLQMKPPTSIKETERFCGFVNYISVGLFLIFLNF